MGNEAFLPTLRSLKDNVEDVQELDVIGKRMVELTEIVDSLEVTDTHSKQTASDMISTLTVMVEGLAAIIKRFKGPAYAYYQSVLAEEHALLDPPIDAITLLKTKVGKYDAECQRKLSEAKLAFVMGETIDEGEALHRATEAAEVKVEGLPTRIYWKTECVDLTALCRAIADGVAPESLVKYNASAGNKLASQLRSTMQYPGIRAYEDPVTVRRKR